MPRLTVRPEAELDALDAGSWYEGERAGSGRNSSLNSGRRSRELRKGRNAFPVVFGEVRRAILHRFPFGVFFIVEAESAVVLAITHLRRHPSVWQTRA